MKTGLILVLTAILAAVGFMAPLMASRIDWEEVQRSREMNAVYFDGEIILDGVLDEAAWDLAEPVSDFIQKLPDTGALATEKTEVRILYNDETLYIGAHCWDSAGRDGIVVNDITRDFEVRDSDGFKVALDTYNDDRNAFLFVTNPAGGRFDLQSTKDGDLMNKNWNGIWYNQTSIDDEGWHLEFAIPFKTLRFTKAEIQEWGINFERRVRRKSEDSYWSPIPPPYFTSRVSAAGTLKGLKGIHQSTNMYLKPFLSAPVLRRENDDWDFQPELGVEVFKWAVTSQLVFDATLNTDFSQVESDDVKTNLTRFSLYFPEKRDFFLENAGVFSWGPKVDKHRTPELLPFFSRRIGLTDDGELVPTLGGARLTGRAGKYSIGIMSMQTDDFWTTPDEDDGEISELVPSTNFSVLRLKRDILGKSDVGAVVINKEESGPGFNRTYGFDSNLNFHTYLNINAYVLKTESEENSDEDYAGSLYASWKDQFWDIRAGNTFIGDDFNPEVGFVPRAGMNKTFGKFGVTPRPKGRVPGVLEFNPSTAMEYITNMDGDLESRQINFNLRTTLNDSSVIWLDMKSKFEHLYETFDIRDDITLNIGDYSWNEYTVWYETDQSRKLGFTGMYKTGGFWNGDRNRYQVGLRFHPIYKFGAELKFERNDVVLPEGDFTVDLIGTKLNYSFSNRMFLNALFQYDSDEDQVLTNIRFNFMYKPLSDLYLVYNERRDIADNRVLDRAITLKLTYVLPF
jgi:Domain of unknown function (DUF5916)/Carbohydrate family 9 binding domain-like